MKNISLKPIKKIKMTWKVSSGLTDYNTAINMMNKYIKDIKVSKLSDIIWLLEHNPVYTCGTSAKKNHLINIKNTPVINCNRGGQVTYHGPGQRIIYVMLNLNNREKDVRKYVRTLEEWMIISLKKFGVDSFISKDRIGLWVNGPKGESKIGALGVRISKWITSHGISININPNLDYYNGIIPCGLKNYPVTSLKELGYNITMDEFDEVIKKTAIKIL